MMSFWQAVVLGALQGVTEFLPVSSSGHLVLLREVLAVGEVPLLFDVLLHLSTLAATAVVFRARLGRLVVAAIDLLRPPARRRSGSDERRLLGLLLLCTVVTGGIGMAFGSVGLPRSPSLVSVMLLVTAMLLLAARWLRGAPEPGPEPGAEAHAAAPAETCADAAPSAGRLPRWPWALLVGVVQGLAVIPGISRSGATIAAGVLAGADRETAADFSFLASVPAILGAVAVSLPELSALEEAVDLTALAAGMAVSFAAGWLALTALLRIVRRGRLHLFSLYLVPVGIIGLTVL